MRENPKMQALATVVVPAGAAAAAQAALVLSAGGLVALPTETVYGLSANAQDDRAVARLYRAKERPSFNPLIAHVDGVEAARRLAVFDAAALTLAAAFWPGPLTLVLPKAPNCAVGHLATAGLDTIAVRVPSHPVASTVLAAFGGPLVAPSANRSGRVSPTSAEHVKTDLDGRIDLIIDGGACPIGIESTVVSCGDGAVRLLRPGAIPRVAIERLLGRAVALALTAFDAGGVQDATAEAARPVAPGMLASHYAPRARVRLNADAVRLGEALLAFGAGLPPGAEGARAVHNLSASGDVVEAAANLFGHLRALDAAGAGTIAVMPIPDEGLGEAINDRLRHAAVPRPARLRPATPEGKGGKDLPGGARSNRDIEQ